MKGSDFVFDYVHLMYYKCLELNANYGGSHIDSPDWKKNKKTINPINKKDNKCFQYAVRVTLNDQEVEEHAARITKIKYFINKYTWKGNKFPSEKDDWTKFEKNNIKILLNLLYDKEEKMNPAYVSKNDSNREKQVILLMIPNGKRWHHLAG